MPAKADTRPYLPPMPSLGSDRTLLYAVWGVGAVLFLWKLWVAAISHVIWEEGHFAVSGQHLAAGYPDIPAGFPWLARAITSLFGWRVLPLRLVALAISACAAPAVWFMARPVVSRRNALWAAMCALLLPPVSLNGTIFYPEGALQVLLALMLGCLLRALPGEGGGAGLTWTALKWWLAAGACAAAGLLVHFRFLVPGLAVVVFLLATAQGRAQWRRPGVWITAGTGFIGLIPALVYNAQHGWPAIAFHVVNRAHFSIDPQQVVDFLVTQIGVTTPVFFVGLAAAARKAMTGDRDRPGALLGWQGVVIFLFYGVQVAINKTSMPHWPFMAYVPLLPWLPGIAIDFAHRARSEAGRWLRACVIAAAPLLALCLGLAASQYQYDYVHSAELPYRQRQFNLLKNEDWTKLQPDLVAADGRARERFGADVAWAALGHISAVRIEFPANPGRELYTLDEPYDVLKSRFVVARRDWGLDRAALIRDRAGKGVVLALNEPSYVLNEPEMTRMYRDMCLIFSDIEPYRKVTLMPGRTTVDLFTARVRATPLTALPKAPCPLVPQLYLMRPNRGAFIGTHRGGHYFGMAADPRGLTRVDILLDHQPIAQAHYGFDKTDEPVPDLLAYDPNWPNLYFEYDLPKGLPSGEHVLSVRGTRADGTAFEGDPRVLYVR